MANETTVIELTWKEKSNNFRSKAGNEGTLIGFHEKQPTGDFKGEPIVFWSSDPKYREASKFGWLFDTETNRVIAPSLSEEEVFDRQAKSAAKHDAKMQY